MLLPLHRSQEAIVQRMLNFFQPGTYIQPHLHPLPHATETIQVLRGGLGFLIFDDEGRVKSQHVLRAGGLGLIGIEARVWHGFVTLEPDTVILEIKRGPYDQQHDRSSPPGHRRRTSLKQRPTVTIGQGAGLVACGVLMLQPDGCSWLPDITFLSPCRSVQ